MKNLYDMLEVSNKASKEVIDRAYKVLAKKYHPDLNSGEDKLKTEEKMKEINYAYSILSNEQKRAEYDAELDEQEKIKEEPPKEEKTEDNKVNIKQETESNEELTWQQYYEALSEKEKKIVRKNIEKNVQNEYRKMYEDYFRSLGYKVKHKWTWREIKIILIVILVIAMILTTLWIIPQSRDWMIDIYNSNIFVRLSINLLIGIYRSIIQFFKRILKI